MYLEVGGHFSCAGLTLNMDELLTDMGIRYSKVGGVCDGGEALGAFGTSLCSSELSDMDMHTQDVCECVCVCVCVRVHVNCTYLEGTRD